MHGSFGRGALAGTVFVEQKGEHDEADGHPRELNVDVLVALHAGLDVELLVERAERQAGAVGASEGSAKITLQRLQMRPVAGIAGLHEVLQVLLVPHGAAGDLGVGECNENTATYVSGEVDETRH